VPIPESAVKRSCRFLHHSSISSLIKMS
jgi:hypothetical protein